MEKKSDQRENILVLTEMIKLYTTQLEEYDRSSSNYVMTVIAFVGIVLTVIGGLYGEKDQ